MGPPSCDCSLPQQYSLQYLFIYVCTAMQVVPLVPEEFSVSALRLIYDVSFFIIVTTIGLNIVFGIIVDTFSELRDERVCISMPLQ